MAETRPAPKRKRGKGLHRSGLLTAAAGLAVLLALAKQLLVRPADQGLLLTASEAAIGMGLAVAGFALMVAGADPFIDDAEGP